MSDLDHTYCSFCDHVTHNRTEPLHKCRDYLKEKSTRLESRLSLLMDVAEKLDSALECMICDAEELRIINRRNLGERRDEKINSTYYAEIEKAKSCRAEWDGIKNNKQKGETK
jgi:hypothetical protein